MPNWVRDEAKWAKAKKLAAKQGRAGDYAYITGIYKKMGGPIASKPLNKSLLSFIRQYSQGGSGGHKYFARVPAPEVKVGTHHTAWKYFYTKKAYDRYLGGPQIKGSPTAQRPGKPKRVFEKPKPVGAEAGDQGVARRRAEDDSRTEQAGKATARQTARLGLPQQIPVDEKRSGATVGRLKFYCVVDNRDSVPAGTRLYVSKAEARKEQKKGSGNLLVSATIGPSYLDVGESEKPKLRLGIPIEKAMQARLFIDLRKADIFRKPPATGPPPIQRKNPGLQLIPSKINPGIRRWQMPGGVESGEVKSPKEEPQEKKTARKFSKGDQIGFLREGGEVSAEVVRAGDQLVAFKTEDGKTGTVRADKAKKKPSEQVEMPGMPKRQIPQTKIGAGKGAAPTDKLPLFVKQAPEGVKLGLPVSGTSKTPASEPKPEDYDTREERFKENWDGYRLTDEKRKADGYGKGTPFEVQEPPGNKVTIYRAVSKDIDEIEPGDYISASKKYAQDHLEMHTSGHLIENPALTKGGKIISMVVNKEDLGVAASNELVWVPKKITKPKLGLPVGGATDTTKRKQPWEMTRGEVNNSYEKGGDVVYHGIRDKENLVSILENGFKFSGDKKTLTPDSISFFVEKRAAESFGVSVVGFKLPKGSKLLDLRKPLPTEMADVGKVDSTEALKRFGYDGVIDEASGGTEIRIYNKDIIKKNKPFGLGHKATIRQALSEGKSVPPETLKDYPDLLKQEFEKLAEVGEKRFAEAKDPFIRALHSAAIDWMTRNERERFTALGRTLREVEAGTQGAPKERAEIKRKLRLANIKFDNKATMAELKELIGGVKRSLGIRVKDWVGARLGLRKAISPTKAPPLPGQKGAPLAQHSKYSHLVLRIGTDGKRHWMLPSPKEKKGRPPKKAEDVPAPRARAPEEGTTAPEKEPRKSERPAKKYKKGQGIQFKDASGNRRVGKVIKTGLYIVVVKTAVEGVVHEESVHVDQIIEGKPPAIERKHKVYPILRPFKEPVTPNTADYIASVLTTTKEDVEEHGGIDNALEVLQDLYPKEMPEVKGKYLYCCTFAKDLGGIARSGLQSNLDPHWGGYAEDEGRNGMFYTESPQDAVGHAETIWKTGFEGGAESMSDPIVFRVEKEKVKHLKMTEGGESFGSIPGAENYEVWFRGGWGKIEPPSITVPREMVPSRMEKVRKEARQAIIDQIKRQKGDFIFHADESVTKILRVGHCVHYLRQGYLNVNGVVEQVLKNGAWIRDEAGQQFEISNDQLLVLACPEQYRTKSVQKHTSVLRELIKDVGKQLDVAVKEQKTPDFSSLNFKQASRVVSFGLLNEAAKLLDKERLAEEESPGKPRVEYTHEEIAGHIGRERGSLEAKIRDYTEGPPREEKEEEETRVKLPEHLTRIVDNCSDTWSGLMDNVKEGCYEVLNQEFDYTSITGTKADVKRELSKYYRPYSVAIKMFQEQVISDKYKHRWVRDTDNRLWGMIVRYAKKASGRKTGFLSEIITQVFGPPEDWIDFEDVAEDQKSDFRVEDISVVDLDLMEAQRTQKLEDEEVYKVRPRDEFEVRGYYKDILSETMKSLGADRDDIDTSFLTDPKKRDTFLDKALEVSKGAEITDWRTGWHGGTGIAHMGPVAISGAAREHKDVRELTSDIAEAQAKGGTGDISKEEGEKLIKETLGLMYDEQIEEDLTVALTRVAKETEYRNKNADKVAELKVKLMQLKRDLKSYKGILAGQYRDIPVGKTMLGIKEGMPLWAKLKVGPASSPRRIGVRAVIEK